MSTPLNGQTELALPEDIAEALQAIWNGASAGDVESETLEIKEDPTQIQQAASTSRNPRAKLIEKLIDEAVCLANGDSAMGHIVVGISDKVGGPEGFTGTDLETHDIERKIFNGTQQGLRVEASAFLYHDTRLVLIRVPEALTLYTRTQGQAKRRRGTDCAPMSEAERQAVLQERINPDFSNGSSTADVTDIEASVLDEARRLLRAKRGRADRSDYAPSEKLALLRDLGLVSKDGTLKRAAEILMLPPKSPEVTVRHLWHSVIGEDPKVTEISDPLLIALPRLIRLIGERASQEIGRVQFSDGQETEVQRFPSQAIDEAVTNAFIHRDWAVSRPVVIDQTPNTLKIWSPGPLPPGVDKNHLLTTQSVPRNSRLMAAMRALGLAEESSRGFDRMWTAMISSGRNIPEVNTTDTFVEVILSAGKPNTEFIKALHELEKTPKGKVMRSVFSLIVFRHLWDSPRITKNQVERLSQISSVETLDLMGTLQEAEIVERLKNSDEWVLGSAAPHHPSTAGDTHFGRHKTTALPAEEWIKTQLRSNKPVYAASAAETLGIERSEVTAMLRELRKQGVTHIDPDGPQRGPNTRWIKSTEK